MNRKMKVESATVALFRRTSLTALFMGALTLGLAGCGGSAPVAPTSTPTTGVEAVSTPTAGSEVESNTASDAASPTAVAENTIADTPTPERAAQGTEGVECAKLNLNELTEQALMSTIPNFSSRMVREFFEYQPYVSIQQFRREIGKYVDENQVAEYEKYVYVPVDPNSSDAETLMQLPGVDATIAAGLISARPYASNEAFLEALRAQVSEQQLAEAACYLAGS